MALKKVINSGISLFEVNAENVGAAINKLYSWTKMNHLSRPNHIGFVSAQSSLFLNLSMYENLELYGHERENIDLYIKTEFKDFHIFLKHREHALNTLPPVERFMISFIAAMMLKCDFILIDWKDSHFNQLNLQYFIRMLGQKCEEHHFIIAGDELSPFENIAQSIFDGLNFVDKSFTARPLKAIA